MAYSTARMAIGFALALALGACGGSGGRENQGLLRTIGLRQPPPDEFLVVERKPLEMPADPSALPIPDPGAINRVDPNPRAEVTEILHGGETDSARSAETLSPGETALLARSGTEATDPSIRAALESEDRVISADSGRFGLREVFGVRTFDPYKEEVLDPFDETRRLRKEGVATPASPEKEEEDPGKLF